MQISSLLSSLLPHGDVPSRVLLIPHFERLCFKCWDPFTLTMLNYLLSIAGTFHRLWGTLVSSVTGANNKREVLMRQAESQVAGPEGVDSGWFIDASDLDFFVSRVERGDAPVRASNWEPLLQKQIPGELVYHAYRRMLKDIRKTEYLSTSVTADTSPHEVRSSLRRLRT